MDTPRDEHWRTKGRQPECIQSDGRWRLRISAAKQKGDRFQLWHRVYSTEWKRDGWATEAAALAARAQFKHWVDFERNVKKRTAQSKAAASRSSASLDALLQSPEPTRVSARKQKFRRDVNDRVQAHLHANIIKCFSRSDAFLPLARIRKFARKTRAYRRAYRDGKPNSLADVERLIKVYKSLRSAEVFDNKFCHEE